MKRVVILVGASGSGKSTWVNEVAVLPFVTVSADHYFIQPDGSYQFDGSKLSQAHEASQSAFVKALQGDWGLIFVDNTNTRAWEREPYLRAAREAGWSVWLKVFDTPAEVCAERNTHGVSLASCQSMAARIDVPAGFYEIYNPETEPA